MRVLQSRLWLVVLWGALAGCELIYGAPDKVLAGDLGCTDVSSARSCGRCGHDCTLLPGAAAVSCVAGECVIDRCVVGRAHCTPSFDDGCETDITTGAHCGSCDVACTQTAPLCATQQNSATAQCVSSCAGATPTLCGTACVDTSGDIYNCGACNHACPAGAGGLASCTNSTCGLHCQTGYVLVNGSCVTAPPSLDLGTAVDLGMHAADLGAHPPDLSMRVDLAQPVTPSGAVCTGSGTCGSGEVCAIIAGGQGVCTRPCSSNATCADLGNYDVPSLCMTNASPAGCSIACNPTVASTNCVGGFVCAIAANDATAECAPPSSGAIRILNQSCNASFTCEPGLECSDVGMCVQVCRTASVGDCPGGAPCTGSAPIGECN